MTAFIDVIIHLNRKQHSDYSKLVHFSEYTTAVQTMYIFDINSLFEIFDVVSGCSWFVLKFRKILKNSEKTEKKRFFHHPTFYGNSFFFNCSRLFQSFGLLSCTYISWTKLRKTNYDLHVLAFRYRLFFFPKLKCVLSCARFVKQSGTAWKNSNLNMFTLNLCWKVHSCLHVVCPQIKYAFAKIMNSIESI